MKPIESGKDGLAELEARLKGASKSDLGGWFVFPEGFAFQITTASGPHKGLHIAQDMRKEDAELVVTMRNALPGLLAAIRAAEAWLGAEANFASGQLVNVGTKREAFRQALDEVKDETK